MDLFKKNNRVLASKSEVLFQEVVKETNELYEDLTSEYEAIETVVAEFIEFIGQIGPNLNEEEKAKVEELVLNLNKVDNYAIRALRDVRDLLRNQRKILSEFKQEQQL